MFTLFSVVNCFQLFAYRTAYRGNSELKHERHEAKHLSRIILPTTTHYRASSDRTRLLSYIADHVDVFIFCSISLLRVMVTSGYFYMHASYKTPTGTS